MLIWTILRLLLFSLFRFVWLAFGVLDARSRFRLRCLTITRRERGCPLVAKGGPIRGIGPGTPPAWDITGVAPSRFLLFLFVMACCWGVCSFSSHPLARCECWCTASSFSIDFCCPNTSVLDLGGVFGRLASTTSDFNGCGAISTTTISWLSFAVRLLK